MRKLTPVSWAQTFLICLLLSACSDKLSKAEQSRYVADVESKVSLPRGAGRLECYQRNYTFEDGAGDGEVGPIVVGYYSFARPEHDPILVARREHEPLAPIIVPGIYMRESGFAVGVLDQGCGVLVVRYDVGRPARTVRAQCYPDISGGSPQRVVPPVEC